MSFLPQSLCLFLLRAYVIFLVMWLVEVLRAIYVRLFCVPFPVSHVLFFSENSKYLFFLQIFWRDIFSNLAGRKFYIYIIYIYYYLLLFLDPNVYQPAVVNMSLYRTRVFSSHTFAMSGSSSLTGNSNSNTL